MESSRVCVYFSTCHWKWIDLLQYICMTKRQKRLWAPSYMKQTWLHHLYRIFLFHFHRFFPSVSRSRVFSNVSVCVWKLLLLFIAYLCICRVCWRARVQCECKRNFKIFKIMRQFRTHYPYILILSRECGSAFRSVQFGPMNNFGLESKLATHHPMPVRPFCCSKPLKLTRNVGKICHIFVYYIQITLQLSQLKLKEFSP